MCIYDTDVLKKYNVTPGALLHATIFTGSKRFEVGGINLRPQKMDVCNKYQRVVYTSFDPNETQFTSGIAEGT
jgi:hypothetical protein